MSSAEVRAMQVDEFNRMVEPVKKLVEEKNLAIEVQKVGAEAARRDRESWRKACVQWEEDFYKLSEEKKALEADRDQWRRFYRDYSDGSVPRFITIDDLEDGQWIASLEVSAPIPFFGGKVTKVYAMDEGGRHVEMDGDETRHWFSRDVGEIYLLKEANKPQQEPERRGEVVRPEELRQGDVYDLWARDGTRIVTGAISTAKNYAGAFYPSDEIRLVERPEPKLPTEPGSVVLVEGISDDCNQGMRADLPFFATGCKLGGTHYWDSLDGKWNMPPEFITKWKPAKVVVE